ncbi:osteoglycin, paralog a [Astyanax mexicanus]|uniref:Mimecan n=2 Tax=Astyanax mexicanus TaxID=7994 RepID=A0A8B9JDL2_ASTMX|nr:osteoglycin, paralog a [Astyanax mexicanus]XP_049327939.1 osteoglycin, paralog a [Astyanax mexicanus]KAG9260343.1 mimecan [Astyanax mexicanus]
MGTRLGTLIYSFILASWVILASGTQHYQESKELPLNIEEAHLETKKSKRATDFATDEQTGLFLPADSPEDSDVGPAGGDASDLPTCLLCVCLTGSVYCEEVDPDMTSVPALPKETAYLYARYNKIKKLSQKDFGDIVTLKRIDLTGNLISEIEDGAFSKLTLLEELTLAENQLVRLPMLPTKLTSFSANHNRLKTKGVKATAFKKLTKLRSLFLAHNELEAVPMIPESVRTLHIQNNNISTVNVDTFCKSNDTYYIRPNLNEIRMDGNPVILAQYPNSFTCLQSLPIGRYQ